MQKMRTEQEMNFTPAKPIEPGCLAVPLTSATTAITPFKSILIVLRRWEVGETLRGLTNKKDNMWLFDLCGRMGHSHESRLMRIDDPDTQTETETELEKEA